MYLGVHSAFNMISEEEVENIIKLPWSGKHYSKRLWNNRTKLKEVIEEQLTQATVQGKDLKQCAREIAETMDSSKKVAERLINTEHAYACSQGDLKMYEVFDVKDYEYLATLDIKTSEICRNLDGKKFSLSEAVPGVNFPPMHAHCRSTTVPVDVDDLEDSVRIARDENGKNIYVDSNLSYQEWYKKYVETNPQYLLKEKKWKNRYSDKKEFEKYKEAGVSVPKSFDKYQDMKYNNSKEYWKVRNQYRSFNAIDKKDWSPEFKNKCKDTIKKFAKEHNLDFNDHSVARYYDRIADKKKSSYMSKDDFVSLAKSKPNYVDPKGNLVIFKNEIAIIKSSKNTNHIISIVPRKNVKEGWVEYD